MRCGRWHPSACGTPLGGCPPRALPLPGSPPHSQAHMLCRHHRHHTPTHTQPPLRRPARRPHPAPCLTHEDLAVGAVGHLHLARVVQQEDAAGQAGWGGKQGRRCELHWWWWSAWRRRPGVCADREARKEAVRGRWVSSDGAGALRRRPGADGDEAATGAARGAHARQRGGGGTSSAGLAAAACLHSSRFLMAKLSLQQTNRAAHHGACFATSGRFSGRRQPTAAIPLHRPATPCTAAAPAAIVAIGRSRVPLGAAAALLPPPTVPPTVRSASRSPLDRPTRTLARSIPLTH